MALVAILSFVPAHVFSSPGCQGRCYRHYAIISIFRITYFLSTKYMAANACAAFVSSLWLTNVYLSHCDIIMITIPSPPPITSLTIPAQNGMAVKASCRKFLDAIALKITSNYNFQWYYSTLEDVFHAMGTNEWDFTKKFG